MKDKILQKTIILALAVLAGLAIGIGSLIYINNTNVYGAFFFSFGLLTVFGAQLKLYTGVIGYAKVKDIPDLIIIFLGNAIGASLMSVFGPSANDILSAKLEMPWYMAIFKGIGCGIIIYLCVREHKAGRTWFTLLGVPAFILCGFEHCVADIAYIALDRAWSWKACGFIGLVAVGNTIGSIATHRILELISKMQSRSKGE